MSFYRGEVVSGLCVGGRVSGRVEGRFRLFVFIVSGVVSIILLVSYWIFLF